MNFSVFLTTIYNSIGLGLIHAPVVIGVFMSLRVMKRPDLTVEGSFAFGAVITMTMLHHGAHFMTAILVAPIGGAIAGLTTALIHTKLKVDGIISGLLVTLSLFSVNLYIMGGSLISAPLDTLVFTPVRLWLVDFGMASHAARLWAHIIVGAIALTVVITVLFFLYSTSFGLSIRATGDNERMACSIGINTDSRKIISLIISNAFIALSGSLFTQQGGADVNIGTGILIVGLASLVIGEIITPKNANILTRLLFIALGSFIYFSCINFIIATGLLSSDWTRLLTAVLAMLAICIPKLRKIRFRKSIGVNNK